MNAQSTPWTIRCSDSDLYPQGGTLEMQPLPGESLGRSWRVSWRDSEGTEYYIDGLSHQGGADMFYLSAGNAVGSDGRSYMVDIWVHESRGMARSYAVIELVPGDGVDPGDLSGTWGADAPKG